MHGGSQSNGNEWRVANRKRTANRKTQTLRIQGKYKRVIGSSDDGTRANITIIQESIERIVSWLVKRLQIEITYSNRRTEGYYHTINVVE
jgi:hypothetical protein